MNFDKYSLTLLFLLWLALSTGFTSAQDGKKDDQNQAAAQIDLLLQSSEDLINSRPSEAFHASSDALKLAEGIGDDRRLGLSCRALARFYMVTAQYGKALEYLLMALERFEQLGDSTGMANCFNEIGLIYMSASDFKEAHANFTRALEINRAISGHSRIAVNYMNMGINYVNADSINTGLSYFLVSLMIADSLNMEQEKLMLMKNIGQAYAHMGDHQTALEHFYKVLELLGKAPDDHTRAEAQLHVAKGYYELKNYPAALKYARMCFDLSGERKFDRINRDAAELLSDIHASRGEYEQAHRYGKIYRSMLDTLMNADRAAQLARVRILYDVSEKEKENLTLREQISQNLERGRIRTLVLIMITTVLLVLAALVYLLIRMNSRYIAVNRKLAAQSRELGELNDLKDKFFSFVALNLKNPFNTIMGFSELMHRAAELKDIAKAREYSGLVYNLSTQVQKVLCNLQEWSRLQRRTFEVKPETVELAGLIKDVAEMNNRDAVKKDINLSVRTEDKIYVRADRTMIATVLQNLVSNAIRFTPATGKVVIDCSAANNIARVTVTDTGIGIPKEMIDKLFDFDFSKARVGHSEGSGLGLILCHEMLTKNGGTIFAESELGTGTRFTFTLPLAGKPDLRDWYDNFTQSSPDDVAENLLKSDAPVNEELIRALKLNVIPRFEEVSRVLSIDELENFSSTLIHTGEKYHNMALAGYGRSLKKLTHGHQIDQIIRILPRFREYLKKVLN